MKPPAAGAFPDLEPERLLYERARAGDRSALGDLLRKHGTTLLRFVLRPCLGSKELAREALAETNLRVIERFDRFRWQPCGFFPWLRVVGRHVAVDILRSKRREKPHAPDDLQRKADASAAHATSVEVELCGKREQDEQRVRAREAMKVLNPRYARAIQLRVLEERSREEVAAALGVTVATFDVLLHRSLNTLKRSLISAPSHHGQRVGPGRRPAVRPVSST